MEEIFRWENKKFLGGKKCLGEKISADLWLVISLQFYFDIGGFKITFR
jgi:hypothetical protein